LTARKQQYSFYRKELLSFEEGEMEWKTFGEVAKIQRGASPRPIAKFITEDKNGVSWIKIGDTLPNSKYVSTTKQKITPEGAKKSRILKKGDFIISNSMSFGRPYILDIDGAIHDGWASISDFKGKLNSDYLYHYLTSDIVQNFWISKINSGSVSNLNADIIKSLQIPIPCPDNPEKSLEIQQEIVRVLDELTSLTNQLKTELETERQNRKKQFEFFREQLLSSDINSVERKKLGEIAKIYDGTHSTPKYKESGIPFVSVQNINNLYATNKYISLEDFEKYKHKPKKNDVFMTRIGSIGVCSIVKNNEPLAYYVTLALIRLDLSVIHQNYFKHVIESNIGKSELFKRTLVNATPIKINLGEISKINLPIPPLAEQERIVKLLDQFDATHTAIEEEITKEIKL